MDVDRETMIELGVPAAAIIIFIALIAAVGSMYGGTEMSEAGGTALLAVLIVFILGMAIVGILLGRMRDDDD